MFIIAALSSDPYKKKKNFSTCMKKFLVHDQIVYCSLLYRLFQFFGVTKKFKCRHNLGKAWWLSWFSDFPVDKEENEMLYFYFEMAICLMASLAVFILRMHYPSGRTWANIL